MGLSLSREFSFLKKFNELQKKRIVVLQKLELTDEILPKKLLKRNGQIIVNSKILAKIMKKVYAVMKTDFEKYRIDIPDQITKDSDFDFEKFFSLFKKKT